MNRYEQRKAAIDQVMREKVDAFQAVYKTANTEKRDPTDEERLEIESYLREIETLKEEKVGVEANIKTLENVEETKRQLGPAVDPGGVPINEGWSVGAHRPTQQLLKTLGEQFVESKAIREMQDKFRGGVRETFTTGAIELGLKGTLEEGYGVPGTGTGGGLITVPQVIPGVVEKLFQPLRVADLLMSGQANTANIRYVVEGTATSGAAGVAEGGLKPQSTLGLSVKDMPVTKMATSLKVSDEMLEDVDQLSSYVNGRLALFVNIEEERQLVNGQGSGSNELTGIIGLTGVNVYARGTVDTNAIALFKAMNGQRGSAFLEPDWFVINPANYQTTRLAQDTAGQFYGGGPFLGAYGGDQQVGQSGQVTGATDTLWGKPCIVTTAVGAGTALIGTRSAAQLWLRGGLSIEATNANENDFLVNLVAIRAEKREALTVFRPSAFTTVTGLN